MHCGSFLCGSPGKIPAWSSNQRSTHHICFAFLPFPRQPGNYSLLNFLLFHSTVKPRTFSENLLTQGPRGSLRRWSRIGNNKFTLLPAVYTAVSKYYIYDKWRDGDVLWRICPWISRLLNTATGSTDAMKKASSPTLTSGTKR